MCGRCKAINLEFAVVCHNCLGHPNKMPVPDEKTSDDRNATLNLNAYNNLKGRHNKLKQALSVAREALEEIANKDFRGNRSNESVDAYLALEEIKKMLNEK
jgi:hypothetical protein